MTDISTITTALSGLKTATDIVTFFRNTDLSLKDAEAKNKIADLMLTLADVKTQIANTQQELLDKNAEIKALEEKLKEKTNLQYENPYYWSISEGKKDGPFCSQCYDNSQKLIRLQNGGFVEGYWQCPTCKNNFQDKSYSPEPMFVSSSMRSEW